MLVVDVIVVGLLAYFPFAVDGVGDVAGDEASEGGALMSSEGFGLFRCVVRLTERESDASG